MVDAQKIVVLLLVFLFLFGCNSANLLTSSSVAVGRAVNQPTNPWQELNSTQNGDLGNGLTGSLG